MKKTASFLISLLITIIIASNIYVFHLLNQPQPQKGLVSKVIDGDTLELFSGETLRLENINSPEKFEFNHELSYNFLKNLENKTISFLIVSKGRYNRSISKVYFQGIYINQELVSLGLSPKSFTNPKESKKFLNLEIKAISSEKGIWKKSNHYGCFNLFLEPQKELIILKNNCKKLNIKGWYIKDESTKRYVFPDFYLEKVIISSKKGKDNSTNLFWNSNSNIWNNDRDTFYLFDEQGNLAHYYPYGY
jgi:endonuclease YncB( thermonuclease family)